MSHVMEVNHTWIKMQKHSNNSETRTVTDMHELHLKGNVYLCGNVFV